MTLATSSLIVLSALAPAFSAQATAQDEVAPPAAVEIAPAATIDDAALAAAAKLATTGKHAEAKSAFDELARIDGSDARVLTGQGRAEIALGLYDDAVSHLSRAYSARKSAELELDLARALHGQAMAKLAEGDGQTADMAFIDARRFYESAGDAQKNAEAWWGAGQVAIARYDDADAVHCFGRALNIDPKHVPSLIALGGVRFRLYVQAAPADPIAAREEKKQSEEAYRTILAIDPRNASAMNGLGWLAKQSGENEDAIEWFHKSMVADPAQNDSFANLCQLLGESRETKARLVKLLDSVVDGSRKGATTAVGKRTLATAFYYRGKARSIAREFDAAKADFAEATRLEPQFKVDCGLQIAKGKIAEGDHDAAAKELTELAALDRDLLIACIQSDPKASELAVSISSIADAKYKENDLDGAREMFRLAAEGLGNHSGFWNNYALLARDTNHFEEAYAAYETALALDPTNPALLNDTAVVLHYNLRRDLDRARNLYEQAIEEGKRVLADPNTDSFGQESATTALRDATNNLRLLNQGRNEEESPQNSGG
jgi:tetratricopeptide (TPR) repeat protein